MNVKEILDLQSMPPCSPSYGRAPLVCNDREYFLITYETCPEAIRHAVPEPLEPDGSNTITYEWMKMPDFWGLGVNQESGIVIPCKYKGEPVTFVAQMYLSNPPAILAGREIWGFPKKFGNPQCFVGGTKTLTGTLHFDDILISIGTMPYKYVPLPLEPIKKAVEKTSICLKLIPDVDGTPKIAQLVAYNMCNTTVKGAWAGPAKLHLIPHVNAPVSDFPIVKMIGGKHFIADTTLPYGRVLHDYLA